MTMTMEEIAEHPELALKLSREAIRKMIYRAISVQQACYTALVEDPVVPPPQEDEVLNLEEAARMLGIASRTLQNGAGSNYRSIRVFNKSRRLAFSRRAIEALQQERGMTPTRSFLAVASRRGREV